MTELRARGTLGTMNDAWHILRVAMDFEKEALEMCREEAYVPIRPWLQFVRRQRKWITRLDCALPGYVFVNTHEPRGAFDGSRPFLHGFLRNGDRSYAIVNRKDMERLREAERTEMERVSKENTRQYVRRRGTTVRVLDGAFDGALATVVSVVNQKLRLEINDVHFPVTVDSASVEVIAA